MDERNSWRKTPRQHRGPITRTDAKVLLTIRSFVDEQTGRCFPSYEAIAKRAGCSRISVARAIKKLENEGFLTWTHGIQPVPVDDPEVTRLFGKQYDMERTSNLYQIRGATPVLSAEAPEVDRGKNDTRVYGNLTFYSYPRKKRSRQGAIQSPAAHRQAPMQSRPPAPPHQRLPFFLEMPINPK